MARLADLSDELLKMICEYLSISWPEDTGQHSLHSVCSTSRRFNLIATPLFYKIARPYKAGVFVRTMFDRPRLAKLVISLDWTKCEAGDEEHTIMMQLIDIIRNTRTTEAVPFQLFVDDRGWNVFGCLTDALLTLLANLEELLLGCGCTAFDGHSLFQRLHSYPKYIHFPTLRRLSYFGSRTHGVCDATSIVPILAMSNARELLLRRCISIQSSMIEGVFNLREIVLESCGLTFLDLEPFIQRTPNLRFFRYEAAQSTDPATASDIFVGLGEILTCLRPVVSRLERLHVHLHCHHGYGPEGGDRDEGAVESLQHFTSLKELEICQSDLTIGVDSDVASNADTDVEVNGDHVEEHDDEEEEEEEALDIGYRFIHKMPHSLERLAIMNTSENLFPELDDLAHDNGEDLPNLKSVWTCGHDFSELTQVFRNWDVKLTSLVGMQVQGPFRSWV